MSFASTKTFFMIIPAATEAFALTSMQLSRNGRNVRIFNSARHFATTISGVEAEPERVSTKLVDLMNDQVTRELEASQLYLSASIWCKSKELDGMASYMREESAEEREHALKFIEFCEKKEIPIKLQEMKAPPSSWVTVQNMWEDLLKAEEDNTQSLFRVNDEATDVQDYAVTTFLQPLHMEQVESEEKMRGILAKVRDESKTPGLIRQLDGELGSME